MKKLNSKGFTLLELLAVLVILAALATIAIPMFTNKGDIARASAHKENLRVIADAAQRYEWDKGAVDPTTAGADTYFDLIDDANHPLITGGYLTAAPASPYASTTGYKNFVYVLGRSSTGTTMPKLVAVDTANVGVAPLIVDSTATPNPDALPTRATVLLDDNSANEGKFLTTVGYEVDSTGAIVKIS